MGDFMKRNLSVMKNMGWALAIILCLLVLFVALIIAAALPYSGPIERGGVNLNQLESEPVAEEVQQKEEIILSELRTLPESNDAGQGYIDGLTFLCDSSVIGLRDYALLSGGTATTQVWGSTAGNIPANSFADCLIRYQAEMVEIRHELIIRRQRVREQMDYNKKLAEDAKQEIEDIAKLYPEYASEIIELLDSKEDM